MNNFCEISGNQSLVDFEDIQRLLRLSGTSMTLIRHLLNTQLGNPLRNCPNLVALVGALELNQDGLTAELL